MNQRAYAAENARDLSVATRLGWVSFFNDCSSEVIARALPLFLTVTLGASPAFVGVIEGLAEAVSILLKGFSGWLSDRMRSRKPLVVLGYSLSVVARIALLAAHVPAMLGLARVFDRTGKGLRTAPRDALIADGTALGFTGRAFGITRFLDTLGAVTGILIVLAAGVGSGPMTATMFQTLVIISIPFGFLAILGLIFFVPSLARKTRAKSYLSWQIPREIRGYLAVVLIFSLGNSSDAFLILKASELGFDFREILIILVLFNILAALLAVPIGKLSDRYGRIAFLGSGWTIYAVTYAVMGTTTSQRLFAAAFLLYGAFYGFTDGVEKALLADLLPVDRRGTGYGALQLVLGLAALPASLITGSLMTHYGSPIALATSAILALLGAVCLGAWSYLRRHIVTT